MVFQDPASLAQSAHEGAEFHSRTSGASRHWRASAGKVGGNAGSLWALPAWEPLSAWSFPAASGKGIAIARALITHPEVIVCDEPVSALMLPSRRKFSNLLREVQERFSLSYLFYLARSFALLALCASIFP